MWALFLFCCHITKQPVCVRVHAKCFSINVPVCIICNHCSFSRPRNSLIQQISQCSHGGVFHRLNRQKSSAVCPSEPVCAPVILSRQQLGTYMLNAKVMCAYFMCIHMYTHTDLSLSVKIPPSLTHTQTTHTCTHTYTSLWASLTLSYKRTSTHAHRARFAV